MRSAYACGALLAFQDAGVSFDALYGTSAGGAAAAWFAQGRADGFARTFDYSRDPQILSWRRMGLRRGPLLDLDFLVDKLYPSVGFVPADVQNAGFPTIVTASTMEGEARYLDLQHVPPLKGLKATMALPLLAGPAVSFDGTVLVDGGVADPVPLVRAIRDGHRDIWLVVNRPERNRPSESRAAVWLLARRHPRLARMMAVHHRMVMDAVHLAQNPPQGVHVRIMGPDRPTGLERFTKDPVALRRTIEQGRTEGSAFLGQQDAEDA